MNGAVELRRGHKVAPPDVVVDGRNGVSRVFVARLRLVNFRSYHDATVEFAPGLNVIVGRNASGKTNLLEGAWFALRASSPRTTKDDKAVRWGAGFARAEATVDRRDGRRRSHASPSPTRPGQAKQVRVDGVEAASLDDLRRQGSVFIFVPESLLLVKGSPARRRAHLDAFAAAIDPAYEAGLRDLNVVLKQRNAHLWRVREGAPADSLDAWDRQLARVALAFEERRRAIVARLSASYRELRRRAGPRRRRVLARARLAARRARRRRPAASAASGGRRAAARPRLSATARGGAAERPSWPPCGRGAPARSARAVSGFGPHRDDLRFAEEARAAAAARAAPAAARPAAVRLAGRAARRRARPAAGRARRGRRTRPATSAPCCSTTS